MDSERSLRLHDSSLGLAYDFEVLSEGSHVVCMFFQSILLGYCVTINPLNWHYFFFFSILVELYSIPVKWCQRLTKSTIHLELRTQEYTILIVEFSRSISVVCLSHSPSNRPVSRGTSEDLVLSSSLTERHRSPPRCSFSTGIVYRIVKLPLYPYHVSSRILISSGLK